MRASRPLATAGLTALLSIVACDKSDQPPAPAATTRTAEPMRPAASAIARPAPEAPATIPVTASSPHALAAFDEGRALLDHARAPEAVASFLHAIELDPYFAQAHAYLGLVTPGALGMRHLDEAVELAAAVPEVERLWISAHRALRSGERVEAMARFRRVAEQAPGDWRPRVILGYQASLAGRHADAVTAFEQVRAMAPDLAIAHNGLAYAYAGLDQWDKAVAAATRQVELLPDQPNPPDTLGEILLQAGRFAEAEVAFRDALAIEPSFVIAWQGVAFARAYRGDRDGAAQALGELRAGAPNPEERIAAGLDAAWLRAGAGKLAAALAMLDTLERDRAARRSPSYAWLALDRAHLLRLDGKYAAAATWYATALRRGDALSGSGRLELQRQQAIGLLRIAAATARPATDADQLVAGLSAEASASPEDTRLQDITRWARGLAAWAAGDLEAAIGELSLCDDRMVLCRYDLAAAQHKAGDATGAAATEQMLRATPLRDAVALYVRARLDARR